MKAARESTGQRKKQPDGVRGKKRAAARENIEAKGMTWKVKTYISYYYKQEEGTNEGNACRCNNAQQTLYIRW